MSGTGNITGGNILFGSGVVSGTGNITGLNITSTNSISAGNTISATGNIISNSAVVSNSISTGYITNSGDTQLSGNITANGNGRILGNLTVDNNIFLPFKLSGNGAISVNGNIAGGNIFSDYAIYANTTITAGGNVAGGNLLTVGLISATGNLNSGNVNTTNLSLTGNIISPLNVTGNITGGNITTTGYGNIGNLNVSGTSNLGSITGFTVGQYNTATSGTVNINRNNGQVQVIAPTANVTIGNFQNFVTSTSNVAQTDSITILVQQGSTPQFVNMPTGNSQIKYSANVYLVGTTANATSLINVTAANISGTATYLVTVSPEFV